MWEDQGMVDRDHVVVITGATGGLGQIVAHAFGQTDSRLALVSTNSEKLAKLENELRLPPERIFSNAADLTQPDASMAVSEAVLGKFGRVDILLHFVGGWIGGKPITQVTEEEISSMLDQHVWTTFHLAQVFIPTMVKNGWGRIIVISSPVVLNPPANNAPYTIGKSAQEALILTLAEELKYTGVTANILRVRTIDVRHERETSRTPKNVFWTTPEEIVSAIEYLCSEDGGVVNGARLPLYGSP
jgi:NAD(P)-dependent dehydrogenase (short-subunit alcohol dehydrogenase family)